MTLHSIEEYGTQFQIKVISSLLTHKEFLVNIHDILDEEHFGNSAHKWIIKEILNYYEKYHTTPSMDVLKTEMKKVTNDVLKLSIKEQLREAYEYLNSKEGEFWKSNILSTKKLREKLSMMILKKNTKVIDFNKKEVLVPNPNKRKRFS